MINTSKLNKLQKRDYNNLRNKLCAYTYFDALVYLNDYIDLLSDTIDDNYLKCIIELKDYYHNCWVVNELNKLNLD